MPPIINQDKCIRCGTCKNLCPLDVFYFPPSKAQMIVRYPEECWHCRACEVECPRQAITIRYPLSHMILHVEKKESE